MTEYEYTQRLIAENVAIAAHAALGQKRKYTGEPYWHHPRRVAVWVECNGGDWSMIAASWLHDVLEDTKLDVGGLRYMGVSAEVITLVQDLTDISKPEDGNRAKRKAIDRDHLARASANAQTIKCADLIDNSESIKQHDPDFWKVYKKEKRELLDVLTRANPELRAKAYEMIEVEA